MQILLSVHDSKPRNIYNTFRLNDVQFQAEVRILLTIFFDHTTRELMRMMGNKCIECGFNIQA